MGDAEDLNLLRVRYEQALSSYEAVCSELNQYLRVGTQPMSADLKREEEARAALEAARRLYLDTWMLR